MPLIETKGAASAQGFGEFTASAPKVYIEDVFSTYLYTGNGSTQTITNGIDLSTKGGLVWAKDRVATSFGNHILVDTVRTPAGSYLRSNLTDPALSSGFITFNSDGFYLPGNSVINLNDNANVSWTFRKQPKFFDIVTYTGNGVAGRTVAHNLGSVPGCIIVKSTTTAVNWRVYHRSQSSNYASLNSSAIFQTINAQNVWGNNSTTISPTSTEFTVGTDSALNASGDTYVAYLFAHDAGGFGLSGTDNVITCGSYTGNGSATGPTVTLGYEPQYLMIKRASGAGAWYIVDNMRGFAVTGNTANLIANGSQAENGYWTAQFAVPKATGFQIVNTDTEINANGGTYIYIAIRRGPMKTPTSGTSVFSPNKTNAASGTIVTTNVNSDLFVAKYLDGVDIPRWHDRLRGYANNVGDASPLLRSSGTDAEVTGATGAIASVTNTGFKVTGTLGGLNSIYYSFRRAPGFFDVVCYTGTGSARTVSHNLGVAPELILIKNRSGGADDWYVYSKSISITQSLILNGTYATVSISNWNSTAPTASVFSIDASVNASSINYVAYLFATVAGVSKVGSYTGTGTTLQIDCGFTAGSRFVLIKRTDSTGDWYVYDSARGIVAGNDPYLFLNSTAAEVTSTDYVDTYSAGFELSSTAPAGLNANGGTYIFLAIA